ncbi:type II toxin-antitoxin system PrlF family antitoxin [Chamaesiphon minutus]|uniref:Putative transcriptional regulator n=1 Tax=Chamaesiphon minutus (strain ATCC 27169 / PCC 6605) TaxID=1173020 RepID=K9UC74_CHAP6|nr:type II toxin-antitoxin system PrlF family antitoxin [Chamaesiphon minutus]AFY92425.1 putative transcriptional regulator [Chamaesiphon minutus PCC 6605]
MRKLRTLNEVTEAYFRDRPEEIDDYLTEIFQDFAEDRDNDALFASLRVLDRVRSVGDMAAQIGITGQGLQTALSARQVSLSVGESNSDPLLGQFLNFLARDLQTTKHLQAVNTDLLNRIQPLVAQVDLDLDAILTDEDE